MKTKIILFAIITFITFDSQSQIAFGVSPGLNLNSAYIGYKTNKFVPFFGFQYFNAAFNYSEKGQHFDYDQNAVVNYEDTYLYSVSVYMPTLGLKYYLVEKEKVKAYTSLAITKPIVIGKARDNGVENTDLTDYLKKLSIWGGELGFGAEYYFDEQFSVGGEFGIRYLSLKDELTQTTTFYNPNTGMDQSTTITNKFSFRTTPTYTKFSLNFYF